MKKINKKILIVLLGGILLSTLAMIIYFVFFGGQIEEYNKYSSIMNIVLINKNEEKNYNINFYNDGKNTLINAHHVNKEIFYSGSSLIYIEGFNKKLKINTNYSYSNVYKYFMDFTSKKLLRKRDDTKTYSVNYNLDNMNEILKNLYLDFEVNKDINAELVLNGNKIYMIKFDLENVGDYSSVKVIISFAELSDDYKVDMSVLDREDVIVLDDGANIIDNSYAQFIEEEININPLMIK